MTKITKTVLLINSEPTIQEVLKDCFSYFDGWQLLSAHSPTEGLQLALQDQPDAILFDLSTFGMNFFTFLKKLRNQPETQRVPVVLIATTLKWFDTEPFQEFHVAGVLEYPTNPTQLPHQIAELLNWPDHLLSLSVE